MRDKFAVLSGVGLAAVAAAGIAVPTQALARDRGGAVTLTAEQWQQVQDELAQLHKDIDQLKAEQQTTRQQVAQAQASATEAQASATEAQASATQAQTAAQTAANDTKASIAPLAWAKDTKVSGRMYFNISSVSAKNAAGSSVEKDGGFQIKRFYVGIDHKFDDVFSGNITVDADNVIKSADFTKGTTSNTGMGLYIKKAYLEAKLDPAFTVRLGSADMPWVPYSEGLYGYRHVEKVLNDLNGFGTSADWGVHVMGSFADGLVSYQVSAIDGGGYRNPQFTKTVDLEGRLSLQYKGFNAAIGGYTGKLGKDVQGATTVHSATRLNALLAYKGKISDIPFTVGGEYMHAKNWNNVTGSLSAGNISSNGYSLFASVTPMDKWSIFGRYDWIKPNKQLKPLQKDQYFNLGIQYSPAKIVDLALVFKRDSADDGLKIGNLGSGQKTRNEVGLYGQFRW